MRAQVSHTTALTSEKRRLLTQSCMLQEAAGQDRRLQSVCPFCKFTFITLGERDSPQEINHSEEMYKLVDYKKESLKKVIKKYKEDNEEYNESVGIINVMTKEYDDIKDNRNKTVAKYQKTINQLKEANSDKYSEVILLKQKVKKLKDELRFSDESESDEDSLDFLEFYIYRVNLEVFFYYLDHHQNIDRMCLYH